MATAFAPSVYQARIFSFAEHGTGHAVIEAVAGSGKSTTLVEMVERLPAASRILFLAYNANIAEELRQRLPAYVDTMTVHSYGLSTVTKALGDVALENNKLRDLAEALVKQVWERKMGITKLMLRNLLMSYVHYVQVTLSPWGEETVLRGLAQRYGLSTALFPALTGWITSLINDSYVQAVQKKTISFDEMIWLPSIMGTPAPFEKYDYVLVDEAQDLSKAQRQLVLGALKPEGRAFFVLDSSQAIYGFAGADIESVNALRAMPNVTQLPLSISYRCPRRHVEMAKKLVPHIEAAPWAEEGEIYRIPYEGIFSEIEGGDLVLCRVNTPLYTLCMELLDRGIPARILGKNVLQDFRTVMYPLRKKLDEFGGPPSREAFNRALTAYTADLMSLLRSGGSTEMHVSEMLDKASALGAMFARRGDYDFKAMDAQLETLTQERPNQVRLATIHGAKGLESDVVFLLRPELLPHPQAKQAWEQQQEKNLKYVALTRAKQIYYFVSTQEK